VGELMACQMSLRKGLSVERRDLRYLSLMKMRRVDY